MKYSDFYFEYDRLEAQAINYVKAYVAARIELLNNKGRTVDTYYRVQDISEEGIAVLAEWSCMGSPDCEGYSVPIEVLNMDQEQQNEHAKQKAEKDIAEEQKKATQAKEKDKREKIDAARRTLAHYGEE